MRGSSGPEKNVRIESCFVPIVAKKAGVVSQDLEKGPAIFGSASAAQVHAMPGSDLLHVSRC